jgi:hypothetical protein
MIRATVLQQVRKMRFEEVYARQARRERGRDRGARIAPALVPPDVKSPPDRGQASPCGASPHWATRIWNGRTQCRSLAETTASDCRSAVMTASALSVPG